MVLVWGETTCGGGGSTFGQHKCCWWVRILVHGQMHLHGWFAVSVFEMEGSSLGIFNWNQKENVLLTSSKYIRIKCLESGLISHHCSPLYAVTHNDREGKNVFVIIIKMKTMEIIRSIEFKPPMNVNHAICIEIWHRYRYWSEFRSSWIMNKMPL